MRSSRSSAIEWFFNIQLVGDHVIEVNPRISTIVYQEDLNLPYLGVKRALGEISDDELRRCGRGSARAGRRCATSTSSSGTRELRRPRAPADHRAPPAPGHLSPGHAAPAPPGGLGPPSGMVADTCPGGLTARAEPCRRVTSSVTRRPTTRAPSVRDGRPLRVTFCPVNTAGVPWTNAQALRRRGVDARLVVFNRYALHPEADRSLDLEGGLAAPPGDAVARARAAAAADRRLPLRLRAHARPAVAPVPDPARVRQAARSSTTSARTSAARRRSSSRSGRRPTREIVGSYDAIRWVPEAAVIPPGVDLARSSRRRRRRAGAAPSSSMRPRRASGRAPSTSSRRARTSTSTSRSSRASTTTRRSSATANADIIVDQLNAGWYGLFAIECMALGKPVVTFLHDEAVRRTEEAFGVPVPLVNASNETLRDRHRGARRDGPEGRARDRPRLARLRRAGPRPRARHRPAARPLRRPCASRRAERRAGAPSRSRPPTDRDRRRSRSTTRTSRPAFPAAPEPPPPSARAPAGPRQAAPAARPPLRDLRHRRARLARHRRAPAAALHALPDPGGLRQDRDAARAHDGDGPAAARGDHERVLPLLLRRRGRRRQRLRVLRTSFWFTMGGGDARARARCSSSPTRLDAPVRHRRRRRTSSAPPASRSGRRSTTSR